MKPITVRELHGQGRTLPTLDEHLPKAPKGYKWKEAGTLNWRYCVMTKTKSIELWCVRGGDGVLCIGVLNHHGYEIEHDEDMDTVVTRVLTMHRLGLSARS